MIAGMVFSVPSATRRKSSNYRRNNLFGEGVAPHVAAIGCPDNPAGRDAACSELPVDVKYFVRVEVRAAVAFRFGESDTANIENGECKDRRRDVVSVVRLVARASEMCTSLYYDVLQSVMSWM